MFVIDATIQCPYCWENLNIAVEPLEASQEYVEDCQVCCQPIVIRAEVEGGALLNLDVAREND